MNTGIVGISLGYREVPVCFSGADFPLLMNLFTCYSRCHSNSWKYFIKQRSCGQFQSVVFIWF